MIIHTLKILIEYEDANIVIFTLQYLLYLKSETSKTGRLQTNMHW